MESREDGEGLDTALVTVQRQELELGGSGEPLNAHAVVEEDELEAERWLRGLVLYVSLQDCLIVPCWCVLTAEEPLKIAMSGGHFSG